MAGRADIRTPYLDSAHPSASSFESLEKMCANIQPIKIAVMENCLVVDRLKFRS